MNKIEKCSTTQEGRKVYHLGDEEVRIYDYEVDFYKSQGHIKGQSDSHKKNTHKFKKGEPSWDKGIKCKDTTKQKISDSLTDYYDTNDVWDKGLTKDSDERVARNVGAPASTKIKKYENAFPNNNMSQSHKDRIGDANRNSHPAKLSEEKLIIKTTKQYLTRKKNNTFNTSKPENELYTSLLEEYSSKTIYKQYKDDKRYPFYCDFYIVEDDLFIELNAHWTHGGKPFDPNDEECIAQLKVWEEKAKTSKFYENAITTWTVRDVKKLKCAKDHNLNYKVIY